MKIYRGGLSVVQASWKNSNYDEASTEYTKLCMSFTGHRNVMSKTAAIKRGITLMENWRHQCSWAAAVGGRWQRRIVNGKVVSGVHLSA